MGYTLIIGGLHTFADYSGYPKVDDWVIPTPLENYAATARQQGVQVLLGRECVPS